MGKTEAIKVEMHHISLRFVVPTVSKDEGEKQQLIEDFTRIGYEGLLVHP